MRGITCIRGRGDKCRTPLRAETDEELVEVYRAHLVEKHPDLVFQDWEIDGDVFTTAYDVPEDRA
ncbi:MAG: hypothetical protein FJW96_10650 [Actinobacteria bacterium]|nr:hypothetical protein [Actinomycetota bacterium]